MKHRASSCKAIKGSCWKSSGYYLNWLEGGSGDERIRGYNPNIFEIQSIKVIFWTYIFSLEPFFRGDPKYTVLCHGVTPSNPSSGKMISQVWHHKSFIPSFSFHIQNTFKFFLTNPLFPQFSLWLNSFPMSPLPGVLFHPAVSPCLHSIHQPWPSILPSPHSPSIPIFHKIISHI